MVACAPRAWNAFRSQDSPTRVDRWPRCPLTALSADRRRKLAWLLATDRWRLAAGVDLRDRRPPTTGRRRATADAQRV